MKRLFAALARVLALPFLLAAMVAPVAAQEGGYLIRPGDTLRIENEVLSKRRSQSRPEMGSFVGRTTVFNQDNVAVMSMVSTGLIRVRNPEVASD